MKLSKLKFVDSKRYKRGVDMDVKMQLLTLALRPGQKLDSKLIAAGGADLLGPLGHVTHEKEGSPNASIEQRPASGKYLRG